MRGVVWNCTQQDLRTFFQPLEVAQVHFDVAPSGRLTGEAYVKFGSGSDADEAVKFDRKVRRGRRARLGAPATRP